MSDSTGRSVPDADAARVAELGYEQELKREFGFFHAFAVSFADTSLIVAFYGVYALSLGAAGPTGGAGLAWPPTAWSLIWVRTFFAI